MSTVSETYYPLGISTTWLVAIIYPPIVLFGAWRRHRKLDAKIGPGVWISSGLILLVGVFGLPMELCTVIGCLVGAACVLGVRWTTSPQVSFPVRIAFSAMFVVMAIAFFKLASQSNTQLTLESDKVVFTDFRGSHSVPRVGLKIDEITSPPNWYTLRGWGSWTTFFGRDLGPDIMGNCWYWGPHGFVLGDAVGERLASWAGVKPKVSPMMSAEEYAALKNKIEQDSQGVKPATGNTTEKQ
jgi:hypothetical protein